MSIIIEPLGKHHDRRAFTCGQRDLDNWFRNVASQDERRNLARVFVAVDSALGVVGFFSLGSFSIVLPDLPAEIARKLPRYDGIPVALIGRLARDERVPGKGIGELLLADAIRRTLEAGKALAVFAIVVDAVDARAVSFYESFGFRAFPLRPSRMFILTSTAAAAVQRI